ncbi:YbaB/EbfC family nucleoid-associated protein [Amycolatopsis acidicola]|uniref:YbaB/EbfC family nucleoid-associated protein n=1 Tax=Amycolatopsis acidicola TaxID=2596893 RepID=A0A5N0VE17_9PSEU|nr:YbaB/EbfC family nucleoid-associated protein [Amycolatopsis acidicola]KAA9163623.1 YbaB/EbfC family nucleoid-associated protein [Amycolatopsis acidicola]
MDAETALSVQREAMTVRGEATSGDGQVTVEVDATGVITGLDLTEQALARGNAKKLSAIVVATAQAAAAQARARMAEALAPLRERNDEIRKALIEANPELAKLRTAVPEVPRTAEDPTAAAWDDDEDDPDELLVAGEEDDEDPLR